VNSSRAAAIGQGDVSLMTVAATFKQRGLDGVLAAYRVLTATGASGITKEEFVRL
jgi:hypothetical protein